MSIRGVYVQKSHVSIVGALSIGALAVFFDYLFHFFETSPMEVPLYFIAKFTVAFLVAYFLINRIGPLLSAAVFTLSFDIYYYFGILVFHINYLSSSPTQIIQIDGITDPITLFILWTVVHGLFFYAAALIVLWHKKSR